MLPMPACRVAPSGTRSATWAAMAWSTSPAGTGATSTSGRSTSVHPTTWLTWTWLRPNVRGMRALTSRKNGTRPMNGRGVVAVGPEREVAVAVHRRGRRGHQRALGRLAQQAGHLAEVVGHQLAAALVEGGAGHVRQEVRDVQQGVPHRPVQVGPVVEDVHLVDAHAPEPAGGRPGLERVDDAHRLAVGERHDDVGAVADVVEHGLGRHRTGGAALAGHARRCSAPRRKIGRRRAHDPVAMGTGPVMKFKLGFAAGLAAGWWLGSTPADQRRAKLDQMWTGVRDNPTGAAGDRDGHHRRPPPG